MRLSGAMKGGLAVLLTAMSVAVGSSTPIAADPPAEWLTVPPQSLLVAAGSPLDFSGMTPAGPAGSRGPLRVTRDGALGFAGRAGAARFNCAMVGSGTAQSVPFPDHEEADALAVQLKRHGYTLVRLHNVDYRLTQRARFDLDIDPEQLDRFQYLLAALKRNGIYWMTDILSQPSRALRAAAWGQGASPDDLRVRMHIDPAARALWLKLVDTVYAARNPYTGASTLADPALAFVIGANENSVAFAAKPGRPYPAGLAAQFDAWVRRRFASPARLAAALPDLSEAEASGAAPVGPPTDWAATGPRAQLFRLFVSALELDLHRWMTARLAERGFSGPILGYHEWYRSLDNRTRAAMPVTDVHAYVGEVASQAKGAQLLLPSVTDTDGQRAVLANAAARWLDRPFVASEYGIPYPNPTRYEGGLIFPALAAFQGWSALCRTAFLPVEPAIPAPTPEAKPMRGYSVGLDPNERAQETLAALLFYRGDVRPATHTVAVPFGGSDFDRPGSAFLPLAIRRAALLARFGLIAPAKANSLVAAKLVPTDAAPFTMREKIVDRVTDAVSGRSDAKFARLVGELRANGTLAPGNRTDPAGGILQSETGEITLDQGRRLLTVVTPRTEAASVVTAAGALPLGALTIRWVDAGALVAATALDARPLATSRKVLLILAGDTINTDLRLSGSGVSRELVDWGHLPILMKRVIADLSLAGSAGRKGWLSTLSLRGEPIGDRRPVAAGAGGAVAFRLDTGAVPGSPTTYFLLDFTS